MASKVAIDKSWAPDRRDIIWINFTPQKGREFRDLHPMLVFTVLSLIGGFERVWILTATLMAGLPPALNVFVMARQYDTYVERASSGVLVGTLVSILTVTGLLWLIAENKLPIW